MKRDQVVYVDQISWSARKSKSGWDWRPRPFSLTSGPEQRDPVLSGKLGVDALKHPTPGSRLLGKLQRTRARDLHLPSCRFGVGFGDVLVVSRE
jgi:hypothetical protein